MPPESPEPCPTCGAPSAAQHYRDLQQLAELLRVLSAVHAVLYDEALSEGDRLLRARQVLRSLPPPAGTAP